MPRFVAFLRAINLGGRRVTMPALRAIFASLDVSDVETFIASGNVIFRASHRDGAALERRIETHLLAQLGYDVPTFLRTDAEVSAIARSAPFPASAMRAAVAMNVGLLSAPLEPSARRALLALRTEIDDLHAHGREVFWLCRKKQSESTFSNVVFERTVGARATFRTMTTMARLAEKYPPDAASSGRSRPRRSA